MFSDLRYRLRALFDRAGLERELDAELRFHLEREVEKHVAAGLPRDEAMRRARLAFGGVERIKDDDRDARGVGLIDRIAQDVRYAARGLRAAPGFAAAVVLTLGLGVGANAAMFGVVDRLLFRAPPGLRDEGTVHRAYFRAAFDGRADVRRDMSIRRYFDLVRDTRSFSTMAAFQTRVLPVGVGDDSRERPVAVSTWTFFSFFDAPPALGRYFGESDDVVPEGRRVVVLSHAFWMSDYGGRKDVIGTRLQVDQMDCEIIGVAPAGFVGVGDQLAPALYVPLTAYAFSRAPRYPQLYGWTWVELLLRRRADVSLEQATADLSTAYVRSLGAEPRYARQLESARPYAELAPVQFARGPQAPREAKVAMWVAGVTTVVLLIACANVANLLLARGLRRRREIALRLALGVSRARLMQQLATETVLLAAAGTLCGLVMARWLAASLRSVFLADADASVLTDTRTLAFAGTLTVGVALLTSVLPALQANRSDLALTLNAGGRDAGATRSRTRAVLVLSQSALCVVLLVGAGLFIRSFRNIRAMRLGYDVNPIVVVHENYRGTNVADEEVAVLDARLLEEARRIPGVVSATLAEAIPFWSNDQPTLFVEGVDSVARIGLFLLQVGSPEYFRTAGTRILKGRAFDDNDGASAPRVMIVGERMAAALWPSQNPIGRCVRMTVDTAPCRTVVGVAEEMRQRSLTDPREYSLFIPVAQYGGSTGTLWVRVDGDVATLAEVIRKRLQPLMPGAAYVTAMPLSQRVEPMMRSWRFGAMMFLGFGVLALVLAALGLYSVIAYGVVQRRQEIGVRMALGASRANVVRLVISSGVRLTLGGVAIGAGIALLGGRWIEPLLFEQSSRDPLVLGSVAIVLLAISAFATAAPALWASRVDPNVTLRAD